MKQVKDIYKYLTEYKNNPFKSFFITNKIKEKPQFNDDKLVKDIKEEFKKDKNNNYIILCY